MDLITGDIILVPFPFTNLTSAKLRPALVILVEKNSSDVIVLPITSQKLGEMEYIIDTDHLVKGSLPLISYVRYNKVATLHASLIRKQVARLKKTVFLKIIQLFKDQF